MLLLSVTSLLALISFVWADALTDFSFLQTMVEFTASQIADTLTMPVVANTTGSSTAGSFSLPVGSTYDTAATLHNITSALAASSAAYRANQARRSGCTAWVNGSSVPETDAAYLQYTYQIPTLAQAMRARGMAFHSEQNLPVYYALGNLSQIIYAFGRGLTSRGIITTDSTIQTITVINTITDAQGAWTMPAWLPGPA